MYCWEAARRSQVEITELLLFRKSTGVILRDALPASQRLCANGPFENCQVRMFVKQLNSRLQQLLADENKTIVQQPKPSTFYIMFHLTLIFYPHHTGMRSQMLYTNGVIWNLPRANVCEAASNTRLKHLLAVEKIFMLMQKSSNLYIIGFNSVRKFLRDCLSTLH